MQIINLPYLHRRTGFQSVMFVHPSKKGEDYEFCCEVYARRDHEEGHEAPAVSKHTVKTPALLVGCFMAVFPLSSCDKS